MCGREMVIGIGKNKLGFIQHLYGADGMNWHKTVNSALVLAHIIALNTYYIFKDICLHEVIVRAVDCIEHLSYY